MKPPYDEEQDEMHGKFRNNLAWFLIGATSVAVVAILLIAYL